MVWGFDGLEVDGTSFEKSGFVAGGYVDSSDVFESNIVEKWTAHFLAERNKVRKLSLIHI